MSTKITDTNWQLMLDRKTYPFIVLEGGYVAPEVGCWADGYECAIPGFLMGTDDFVLDDDDCAHYVCTSEEDVRALVQKLWDKRTAEQQDDFETWLAEFPWLKIAPGLAERRRKRLLRNAKDTVERYEARLRMAQQDLEVAKKAVEMWEK